MSDFIDMNEVEASETIEAVTECMVDRETMVPLKAKEAKSRIKELYKQHGCVSVRLDESERRQIRALLLWSANNNSLRGYPKLADSRKQLAEKFKA